MTISGGAYIDTGSVVMDDFAAALVIARARQVEKPSRAKTFRAARVAKKKR